MKASEKAAEILREESPEHDYTPEGDVKVSIAINTSAITGNVGYELSDDEVKKLEEAGLKVRGILIQVDVHSSIWVGER